MKDCLIFVFMSAAGIALENSPEKMKTLEDFTIPYLVYQEASPEACVGLLIHPKWVLTAAHCSLPKKIRLGVYQPNIKNENEQLQNYSLTVTHPEFDGKSLKNDLMLIKLSKNAAVGLHVGTIAIAIEPLSFNDSCFIPTWTWNNYKNLCAVVEEATCTITRASSCRQPYCCTYCCIFTDPDTLTWINQYILPSQMCLNMLQKQEQRTSVNIMCVGQLLIVLSNIKEVSASPAICSGRVYGILSWTKGVITLGSEGFFTEVHPYARWIMEIMSTH